MIVVVFVEIPMKRIILYFVKNKRKLEDEKDDISLFTQTTINNKNFRTNNDFNEVNDPNNLNDNIKISLTHSISDYN